FENWVDAINSYNNVLKVRPQDAHALKQAVKIYQNEVFDFEAAFRLSQQWAERNPTDPQAQIGFADKHFSTGRFYDGVKLVGAILKNQNLSADDRIVLRGIEFINLLAL